MIRFKSSGVRVNFASEPMRRMLRVLGELDRSLSFAVEIGKLPAPLYAGDLVITSANDSKEHSRTSRHYVDEAIDIRSHNFTSRQAKRTFRETFEMRLGPQFRVLLEFEGQPREHFHVQVRKGHTYKPEGF